MPTKPADIVLRRRQDPLSWTTNPPILDNPLLIPSLPTGTYVRTDTTLVHSIADWSDWSDRSSASGILLAAQEQAILHVFRFAPSGVKGPTPAN